MKYFARIKFVGTGYCGFQSQKNGGSVQEKLTEAARALFGPDALVTGCSRTDSGVHANDFCVTIETRNGGISADKMADAMNVRLPPDIALSSASLIGDDFHPRYGVLYKEYIYKILNSRQRDPFFEGRAYQIKKTLTPDRIAEMDRAARLFMGKADFASYMAKGSKINDTVRTVRYASVTYDKENELIVFTVAADGFLYNMVRIMAGTLIDVGYGKIKAEDITGITHKRERGYAGPTLPAHGLYLNRVVYPFDIPQIVNEK